MRLPTIILITVLGSVCIAEPNAASYEPTPGKEVKLTSPAGDILVFVPADYNESCDWPVIFYYHGQGETLSTERLQTATAGQGFVIVSMEFAPMPAEHLNIRQYKTYVEQEMKNLGAVRHMLQSKLRINPKMTVLAGVSRGGWLVSSMIDYRPQIASAALITCAGIKTGMLDTIFTLKGKAIFIGAGENDQNLSAAQKAAAYFANRGAEVEFECWKGLGHEVNPNSQMMQEWLSKVRKKLTTDAQKAATIKAASKTADQSSKQQK